MEFLVHGLVRRIHPHLGRKERPPLGVEAAVQPRRTVFGNERRLDGNGAGAAEGVAEGILPPIAGQQHHGRRQRLPQGSLHAHGPVAPLVKPLTGGIQTQGCLVLEQGEAHLILHTVLRELLPVIMGLHSLHHGLLDDGLAGRHGVQLGGNGVALHREGGVLRQIVLPRNGTGPLKQLLEAAGREAAQHQQHPCAAPQVQVQPCRIRQRSPAEDAAVLRLHLLQAQSFHFVAYQLFKPQQAGDQIRFHRRWSSQYDSRTGAVPCFSQYIGYSPKAQERQKISPEGLTVNRTTRIIRLESVLYE